LKRPIKREELVLQRRTHSSLILCKEEDEEEVKKEGQRRGRKRRTKKRSKKDEVFGLVLVKIWRSKFLLQQLIKFLLFVKILNKSFIASYSKH